ncbi:tail fiber assembly protein [Superficieibacter sp. BNK-5]|uniref:tail fiber assembly protein n=1 Tax=Superficieibacter sp. BNK-5 TaxID=3376142 RepID=UPI0039BF714F
MSSQNFYSPLTGGFYNSINKKEYEDSVTGWPSDALAVSDKEYAELLAGQERGLVILPGENGMPFLSEPVIDWMRSAQTKKDNYLSIAAGITSDWRTELQLGIISEEDKGKLSEWMSYIKELKDVDISGINNKDLFDNLNWPVAPSL